MGRPKGSSAQRIWADALRKAALERSKEHGGARKMDIAAKAMVDKLAAGDATIMREFGDRIDGKVPQALTGSDGGPLTVVVRKFADD